MSTSKIVPIGGRRIIVNFLAGAMQTVVSLFAGFFSSRWLLLNIGEVDIGLFNVIGGIVALAGVFGVFWGRALFRLYGYTLGENVDIQEKLNQYFNLGLLGCGIVIALLACIGYPLGFLLFTINSPCLLNGFSFYMVIQVYFGIYYQVVFRIRHSRPNRLW